MTALGLCVTCGRETGSCFAGRWECVECRFGCSVEQLMRGEGPTPPVTDRRPGETRQAWRMRQRQAGGS